MASIYDKIQTPEGLVKHVMVYGRSTKQEDICRMQDIIGRAPIEDLAALANNEVKVCKDRGTRDTFYSILFGIWNWEDAVRFWNEHSNQAMAFSNAEKQALREDLIQERQVIASLKHQLEGAKAQCKVVADELELVKNRERETIEASNDYSAELQYAKQEILVLKAKLYDMMTKEGK